MFNASWHAFLDSDPMCRATWIATTRIFSFVEWTRGVGVHRWASTWQGPQRGPTLDHMHNPNFENKPIAFIKNRLNLTKLDECADLLAAPAAAGPYLTSAAPAVLSLSAAAPAAAERVALPRAVELNATSGMRIRHPCVAFMHVVKSGGHTIKTNLFDAVQSKLLPLRPRGVSAHICTCEGRNGQCAAKLGRAGRTCDVLSGTNVMQVHEQSSRCQWLTMVRDPIATLISSLHYCRHPKQQEHSKVFELDQLCGDPNHLDAKRATPRQWAAYRRAPLFWTLALAPQFHRMLHTNWSIPAVVPAGVWTAQAAAHRNDDRTRAVASSMAYAIANGSLFSAVGIVEQWNRSMRAFDAVVPLAAPATAHSAGSKPALGRKRWANWTALHIQQHSSAAWAAEEKRDLEAARRDPVILELLALDIQLYTAFVAAFQRQTLVLHV